MMFQSVMLITIEAMIGPSKNTTRPISHGSRNRYAARSSCRAIRPSRARRGGVRTDASDRAMGRRLSISQDVHKQEVWRVADPPNKSPSAGCGRQRRPQPAEHLGEEPFANALLAIFPGLPGLIKAILNV